MQKKPGIQHIICNDDFLTSGYGFSQLIIVNQMIDLVNSYKIEANLQIFICQYAKILTASCKYEATRMDKIRKMQNLLKSKITTFHHKLVVYEDDEDACTMRMYHITA